MAQDPASRDAQILVAETRQPVFMTDDQFQVLLTTVQQRRQELVNALHALDDKQKRAVAAFEGIAAGMGVADFARTLTPLARRNNTLSIRVPDRAVRARVYSEARVVDISLEGCPEWLQLADRFPPTERVARVEFFDARNVLLDVTGGEPVNEPIRGAAGS